MRPQLIKGGITSLSPKVVDGDHRRLIVELIAAGIPEGPFHQGVTLWKTHSGSRLHRYPGRCKHAGSSTADVDVTADVLAEREDLCRCVRTLPDGPVLDYAQAAVLVLRAEELVAHLRSGCTAPGLPELRVLQATIRAMQAASPLPSELVRRGRASLEQLEALASDKRFAGLEREKRRLCTARAARELLCSIGASTSLDRHYDLEPPFEPGDKALYEDPEPWRAAWSAWSDALARGVDALTAQRKGVAAALAVAGDVPRHVAQVPRTARLSREAFAEPVAWATAEWRTAVEEHLEQLVQRWASAATARLQESPGAEHVVRVESFREDAEAGEFRALLETFECLESSINKDVVLAFVPELVAAWLVHVSVGTVTRRAPSFLATDYGPVPANFTPGCLEVADRLWADGAELGEAIQLACLVA